MASPLHTLHDVRWNPVSSILLLTITLSSVGNATAQEAPATTEKTENADPGVENAETENPFPGRFPAASLDGGVEWLNTKGPVSLKDVRGKVVLLDFWTYACINCIHVLPDLKFLEKKYNKELVVIGVHAAKFENEKETKNIREAVLRYEIEHPVVNDAGMVIARKYGFNSWPTLVIVDPEGQYVGYLSGEGNREVLDDVISKMIAFHKAKGTLNEEPLRFDLEREDVAPTPLRFPGKLLADADGNRLFISDSNHNRIVVASLDGELLDVIGTGTIGSEDGGYAAAQFDHPQGMALHGETLYVADTENHLLRAIDLNAKQVSTLAGTGEQARRRTAGGSLLETPLNSPWDVLIDNDVLYVAMAGPHQMWSHQLGSETISVYAGSGREDIVDGPRDTAALAQPSGIATDGESLFIVDSEGSAVRRITTTADGKVTTLVGPHDMPRGRALFEFGDTDGVGDAVRLQHPLGILFHQKQLFIADTYNHRVKTIDPATRRVTSWLGTGVAGTGLHPVQLAEPAGLAAAGNRLFIADTNNHRVLVVNLTDKSTQELTIPGLSPPQ